MSYIVTSVPTSTSPTVVPQRPGTDATLTSDQSLVDHGDGRYTYTFFRNVAQVAGVVNGYTDTTTNFKADLGDVSYEPARIHRLVVQVGGSVRGTGTNTEKAEQLTASVPMANPANLVYDFIPATGAVVAANDPNGREVVKVEKCFECHKKFTWHGGDAVKGTSGARQDTRYCVLCHTDQRKYGRPASTPVATAPSFTGSTYRIADADGTPYAGSTATPTDRALGNLPNLVHKIHMGEGLKLTGYNYANVLFNEVTYPQDVRNCTKCHDGTSNATNQTAQGDNWKNVPSRLACGACHDNVYFGANATPPAGMISHPGGAQADDSQCATCHTDPSRTVDKAYIPLAHIPVTPIDASVWAAYQAALLTYVASGNTNAASIAGNHDNLPAGAIKVTYDVKSVSRDANQNPVIVFKMLQNGTAVPFIDRVANPTATEIWDSTVFVGSPSVYFVFSLPQDNIQQPADFNVSSSSYIRSLWNGTATSGAGAGTLTGPDVNGYYTATLTGTVVPNNAVMLTGGVGFTYSLPNTQPLTQINLPAYPYDARAKVGGLIVAAPTKQMVATGYTPRRAIVEDARCDKCHLMLGLFGESAFHGGQRNDGSTCSFCHTPNRTSSGWSADAESYIHSIHGSAKRTVPFTWHASSTTSSFANVTFPGVLKKCETCHLPGTYSFEASASANALPNRLFRTVGQGIYNRTVGGTYTTYTYSAATTSCTAGVSSAQTALGAFSLSPYVTADALTNYGLGYATNVSETAGNPTCDPVGNVVAGIAANGGTREASPLTLVSSPVATACFACHDTTLARAHMAANGGSIYQPRSTALATVEQCLLCHGPGRIAAIADMHNK